MRITEVSLRNIKSYQAATISFPLGTIAISGPNGAGKSTILEAIGFALFDFLPYRNQREFMRHNALEADVRVTFLSRLDECPYQAVRTLKRATGTDSVTSSYYVYSLDAGGRVAQQKQEVQDFLRSHIGLDDYADLGRVFDNVLGVPQGRLTADFLLTPAQRKGTFDPLLRVDAYRRVYERLRDVLDALQGNVSDQERRVSALEPEAARLPDVVAALAEFEKQQAVSAKEVCTLATAQARLQEDLHRLEVQRRTLEQQRDLVKRFTQQQQHLQNRLEAEQAHVTAAMEAVTLTQNAAPGYAAYRKAQEVLATLEEERKSAEALQGTRHTVERKLVALQTRQAALAKAAEEASAAAAQRDSLMPRVVEQERLEASVQGFSLDLEYARQHGDQVMQVLGRIAASEDSDGLTPARINLPSEPAASAAAARDTLEDQQERLQEVSLWLEQRRDLRNRYNRLQTEHIETAKTVAHCESFTEAASRLSGLGQELKRLQDRVSAFEAQRRFNEESHSMAADGLCPFFKDACPKVEDGHDLTPVLVGLIRDYSAQAEQALAERQQLEKAIIEATSAQKQVDRLHDLRPRLENLEEELLAVEQQVQDLTQSIGKRLQGTWSAQDIANVIEQLDAEGKALNNELANLGNPRLTAERLYVTASEYESRSDALAEVKREHHQIELELKSITEDLAPYADLQKRVAQQRHTAELHRDDFEVYLQHEKTAADLPQREEALAALTEDAEESMRAVADSQRLLAECEEAWNPTTLSEVQAHLNKTQSQLGAANERTRHLNDQIERSKQEIAALEESARALDEAKQALVEAQEVHSVTGFLRNVIRDAGPHITRHLIQQVSAEANTLFSEIMGDASAQLSLTEDYDIILEQHGYRRAFMQLSGGEQMSAAVAVRLGLLRQLSDINLAFFDEPTQNMDAERRHNLAEQLERVKGFDQLFVISHDDTFEPLVSTVLRVRKENGVSTVSVE
ncbi:MAG: SMC family ATPase [Chloroflexota bacterium]|nr:SMC family ATPase [Chloroflexota bacterium]